MFTPPSLTLGAHILRPFRNGDATAWYAYLTDPRVTEHTSWPPITLESITSLVETVICDFPAAVGVGCVALVAMIAYRRKQLAREIPA